MFAPHNSHSAFLSPFIVCVFSHPSKSLCINKLCSKMPFTNLLKWAENQLDEIGEKKFIFLKSLTDLSLSFPFLPPRPVDAQGYVIKCCLEAWKNGSLPHVCFVMSCVQLPLWVARKKHFFPLCPVDAFNSLGFVGPICKPYAQQSGC